MSTRASTARALRPTPAAYGTSYWLDRVGRRPAPATRLAGDVETDVVVVGGGPTGCLTACLFARAGVPVVVLEAERFGDRAALDAGWIRETPGVEHLIGCTLWWFGHGASIRTGSRVTSSPVTIRPGSSTVA